MCRTKLRLFEPTGTLSVEVEFIVTDERTSALRALVRAAERMRLLSHASRGKYAISAARCSDAVPKTVYFRRLNRRLPRGPFRLCRIAIPQSMHSAPTCRRPPLECSGISRCRIYSRNHPTRPRAACTIYELCSRRRNRRMVVPGAVLWNTNCLRRWHASVKPPLLRLMMPTFLGDRSVAAPHRPKWDRYIKGQAPALVEIHGSHFHRGKLRSAAAALVVRHTADTLLTGNSTRHPHCQPCRRPYHRCGSRVLRGVFVVGARSGETTSRTRNVRTNL